MKNTIILIALIIAGCHRSWVLQETPNETKLNFYEKESEVLWEKWKCAYACNDIDSMRYFSHEGNKIHDSIEYYFDKVYPHAKEKQEEAVLKTKENWVTIYVLGQGHEKHSR